MRTGIYLAPERGGVNFCGMMGRDIAVRSACKPSLPSEESGQKLSVDAIRTVSLGLSAATSLKKSFGRKAEGRTPLNDHPAQSAGLALSDFFRMRAKLSAKQSLWQEPSNQAWVVATELISGY
jgi:hypothetical protein